MSLRIFHIFFVIICVGLSLWVGLWGINAWLTAKNGGALALALVFLASGAALVIYGTKVFAKLRDLP